VVVKLTLLIPHVFHQIWVGSKPMPPKFLYHHPTWHLRLWTDNNMLPLINQQLYERMSVPSQKADIASYEILYRFGGVYIDTDFECQKNIEPLLAGVKAFAASEKKRFISHGIMGGVPNHPAYGSLVNNLPQWVRKHPHKPPNVQTGPFYISAMLKKRQDFVVFPPTLFYPYSWRERHKKKCSYPDAYAIHHWTASWRKPKKG